MENHLVIGLGGTGGKVIRAVRKAIYQEFRKTEPDGVKLRFLYVDSSRELMGLDDPTWRTLGVNVQLDPRSQLSITGSDLNKYSMTSITIRNSSLGLAAANSGGIY